MTTCGCHFFSFCNMEISDSTFSEFTWPSILQEQTRLFQPFPVVYIKLTALVVLHKTLVCQSFPCTGGIKIEYFKHSLLVPSIGKYSLPSACLLALLLLKESCVWLVFIIILIVYQDYHLLFSRFATGRSVSILCDFVGILYPRCRTLHFLLLNVMRFLLVHSSSLLGSF